MKTEKEYDNSIYEYNNQGSNLNQYENDHSSLIQKAEIKIQDHATKASIIYYLKFLNKKYKIIRKFTSKK